jgi:membrane protein YqaA with SNARE-associated domain
LVGRLGVFVTWWGVLLLGALDSSVVFFMPFGIDALVIYLAARDERLFWIYPLLATAGSVAGAAVTFWVGSKAGDAGLHRLVPGRRLERFRARVRTGGALAMAVPAILPPPFPLTPFVLTCGALHVDRRLFFPAFALMRLLRFSAGAALARVYGRGILQVLESDAFRIVIVVFIVTAIAGTIASAVFLWRGTHPRPVPAS